mmetsp:Transcript_20375/g.30291  ORF Transcript_20375/g.30291 Transcript_20375/m.30291 type:complete len:148 (+) Transcript_20375:58-501(+)|eukprot:CAMPEP_0201551908 /NCGR_PEP_ID=MMETSP0173_2-20130828/12132_1 /ASSEMBLY_ACC=CAM_ASM_000268 /TAXON_ID=218659 /ORGANISM="Vexillifera sp., Strain DIVA3 564/2" /LENGTH=147 /DNA_ID=CAMNT_0047962273 /DNA_START=47 /DNA_END=490 /DNA_ORIENTATION=-
MSFGAASKCPKCGKRVYFAERQQVLGQDWHKLCVKCEECNQRLAPGSYSENNGKVYCKTCYSQVTGIVGYGFGQTGSGLASFKSYGGSQSEVVGGSAGAPKPESAPKPNLPGATTASGGGTAKSNFCAECGTKSDGGNFCSSCGNKL